VSISSGYYTWDHNLFFPIDIISYRIILQISYCLFSHFFSCKYMFIETKNSMFFVLCDRSSDHSTLDYAGKVATFIGPIVAAISLGVTIYYNQRKRRR